MARREGDTRAALLDAGLGLLREMTTSDLVAAMRTRTIAARARVSPSTFFHHFESIDAYAEALLEHAFTIPPGGLRGAVADGLREAQRSPSPADRSINYHARDLERVSSDLGHRARIGLWALGGADADKAFAGFVAESERQFLPQAQALHLAWGREVRPPLDEQSYLALQIALLYGASLRHVVDPTVVNVERYARAAAALSMVMLRPVGDRRTMDDRLSEMNWLPTRAAAGTAGQHRRDATRARLLDAAGDLFADYGYGSTSVNQVARAARTHVATLYDHFPSKAHLGVAALGRIAEPVLSDRVDAEADPTTSLVRHLRRVARLVESQVELARVYLSALACGDEAAAAADVLLASTHRHVAPLLPALTMSARDRTTEQLLVATIGAVLRHPGDGRDAAVASAMRYLDPPGQMS